MAYKVFTNGSVLNASEINDNLMRQSVMVFSNAAARTAAISSPVEGMLTWLEDTNRYESYNGSAWVSPFGSTLLATSTFTGQTGVALDNIFTSEYRFYDIFFTGGSTIANNIRFRLRSGGSDLTTSTYTSQNMQVQNASFTGEVTGGANTDSWYTSTMRTSGLTSLVGTLFNPFTVSTTQFVYMANDPVTNGVYYSGSCVNTSSASYNGVRWFTNSGSFSGTVAVYGRKS